MTDESLSISIPFQRERVDEEKREVWGWAASEAVAADGRVLSHESNVKALGDWFPRGNVREMHAQSAVGRAVGFEPDDAEKRIWCGVRISRGAEDAWQKVLDGTYQGFSVKGVVKRQETKILERSGRKEAVPYVTDWDMTELSLVDVPSDPGAVFSDIIRGVDLTDVADEGELSAPEGLISATAVVERAVEGDGDGTVEAPGSASPIPAAPAPEGIERAMDDVDADGNPDPTPDASDELVDAQGAQLAIQVINELIAREAAEQAADGDDETWDIDLLNQAKMLLQWFADGEMAEAVAYLARRKDGDEAMSEMPELKESLAQVVQRVNDIETRAAEIQRAGNPLDSKVGELETELASAIERVNRLEEQPRDNGPMARITRATAAFKAFPGDEGQGEVNDPSSAFDELRRALPAQADQIDRLHAEWEIRHARPVARHT